MLQHYAIAILLIAWLTTVLTIGFGLYLDAMRDVRHMVNVVGGLASAFLWFLAAFGASSLEVVDSGVPTVVPATAASYLFAGFGVFMLIVALLGTTVLLNVRDIAANRSGEF